MKRKSIQQKAQEVNAFCKRHRCESCPLIMTEYCQRGSEEPKAIEEAYKTMKNSFFSKELNLPKEKKR